MINTRIAVSPLCAAPNKLARMRQARAAAPRPGEGLDLCRKTLPYWQRPDWKRPDWSATGEQTIGTGGNGMDFAYTDKVEALRGRVQAFMDEHVVPNLPTYRAQQAAMVDRWQPVPIVEDLKRVAKAEGLWNLFLPESRHGAGLTNLEYAPLAEIMGRIEWASEVFNCSAPDTGNMETIERYGSEAHNSEWLEPLLAGEIRSAFCMTEPDVASSDATNIQTSILRDGDDYVINGRKWWSSGAGDPRCKLLIVMGKTAPDGEDRYRQQSMVLVRRTVTPRSCSRTSACRRPTSCSARAGDSRLRRAGWVRDGSTTVCGRSGWRSGRWKPCAGDR